MTEAERVKPRALYVEEAIALALESRWQEALTVNNALVERHGADEDTYNRIGKAQTELGHLRDALEAYTHTLELNPLNLIAQKNTRKIATLMESSAPLATTTAAIDVDLFTEEPGVSVLSVLVAPQKSLSVNVAPGDVVELDITDARLEARTSRGVLLGDVDPKLARRLIGLIEKGNRYTAAVARVEGQRVEIMIREEFQSAENTGTPSFPVSRTGRATEFRPYAKDSLLASRGIDAEGLDAADADDTGDDDDSNTDDGMQTSEDFDADATAPVAVADDDEEEDDDPPADDDSDARPEDSY